MTFGSFLAEQKEASPVEASPIVVEKEATPVTKELPEADEGVVVSPACDGAATASVSPGHAEPSPAASSASSVDSGEPAVMRRTFGELLGTSAPAPAMYFSISTPGADPASPSDEVHDYELEFTSPQSDGFVSPMPMARGTRFEDCIDDFSSVRSVGSMPSPEMFSPLSPGADDMKKSLELADDHDLHSELVTLRRECTGIWNAIGAAVRSTGSTAQRKLASRRPLVDLNAVSRDLDFDFD